jgi:hypothetical protein
MIDNNSPPNTAHNFHRTILSKEQLFQKGAELKSHFGDSCSSGLSSYKRTRTRTESSPLFPLDFLVLRMISLLQPFLSNRSGQLMHSTPRIKVGIWSVCDPWMPLTSLGQSRSSYGVETMGSVHGMVFPFTTFCSKG